jgi:hypothetical protein
MSEAKIHSFKARIYKTGINFCVDVPKKITSKLIAEKGYIKVKGKVNGYPFTKSLVPVKGREYRLFINMITLKGGNTDVGKIAKIDIEQDLDTDVQEHHIPPLLAAQLRENGLKDAFDKLSQSVRRNILKYLSFIKTEETFQKHIRNVITQLEQGEKNVRIP